MYVVCIWIPDYYLFIRLSIGPIKHPYSTIAYNDICIIILYLHTAIDRHATTTTLLILMSQI